MKSRSPDLMRLWPSLLPLALLSCAPRPHPAPAPPAPVVAPPPPQPVRVLDWREWPTAAGRWQYMPAPASTVARYVDGQTAHFVILCDRATRRVTLMRAGTTAELTIIATTRTARFPAGHVDHPGGAMSGVILNVDDAFLDVIAFSRGKFAVTSPDLPDLVLPAWAEPARVIEDCRK